MNFWANLARMLRKLDHVLLWILSNDIRLLHCSPCAEQKKSMASNVLPLHFAPSQASSGQNLNVDSYLQYILWSWFLETKLIWVIFNLIFGGFLRFGPTVKWLQPSQPNNGSTRHCALKEKNSLQTTLCSQFKQLHSKLHIALHMYTYV